MTHRTLLVTACIATFCVGKAAALESTYSPDTSAVFPNSGSGTDNLATFDMATAVAVRVPQRPLPGGHS